MPDNLRTLKDGKPTVTIINPMYNWIYRKLNPNIGIKAKKFNLKLFLSTFKMRILKSCEQGKFIDFPTDEQAKEN